MGPIASSGREVLATVLSLLGSTKVEVSDNGVGVPTNECTAAPSSCSVPPCSLKETTKLSTVLDSLLSSESKNGLAGKQPKLSFPSLSLHHHHRRGKNSSHDSSSGAATGTTRNDSSGSDDDEGTEDVYRYSKGKREAEQYAVALLSRPLQLEMMTSSSSDNHADSVFLSVPTLEDGRTPDLDQIPATLLQNIYSSFAILVDSRLHAYTVVLARHAIALSPKKRKGLIVDDNININNDDQETSRILCVKQKLDSILQVGAQVSADAIVTRFEFVSSSSSANSISSKNDSNNNTIHGGIPLVLFVAMDFRMKGLDESMADTMLSVAFAAPGETNASFASDGTLESIHITLDTNQLLSSMIQEASRVVSTVVEVAATTGGTKERVTTSTAASLHEQSKLRRSASFLAMPPPLPKHKLNNINATSEPQEESLDQREEHDLLRSQQPAFNLGLDLLSQAASEEHPVGTRPVVSPDMSGVRSPVRNIIPALELIPTESTTCYEDGYYEDGYYEDDLDVSNLSLDQCANIIDTCLFEADQDYLLTEMPCNKKIKLF